jgi:hypothetical protein
MHGNSPIYPKPAAAKKENTTNHAQPTVCKSKSIVAREKPTCPTKQDWQTQQ